jgi:hypothetical protein
MRSRTPGFLGAMLLVVTACGGAASSPPAPTAIVTATATPSATTWSTMPPPTVAPETPAPSRPAAVVTASLPIRADAARIAAWAPTTATTPVQLAPAADDRLFVAIPATTGTVLALLDARGEVRSGWPVLLAGASDCTIDADPADGSVRAVCAAGKAVRAYSLDAAGRLMDGWPVTLPPGDVAAQRLIDSDLYLLAGGTFLAVMSGGSVRTGPTVRTTIGWMSIGPDGTLYTQDVDDEATAITATTLDGVREGWPVRVSGWVSAPSFGPDGRVYVTADSPAGSGDGPLSDSISDVIAFESDGRISVGWPVRIPIDTWRACPEGACAPNPPVVTSDGAAYIVAAGGGTVAYQIGPTGDLREGWPYRSKATLADGVTSNCTCPCPGTCVCPATITLPAAGPDDVLYLAQSFEGCGGGDRIVAIATNGQVRPGWPVTLSDEGAWFETFEVGETGDVFGYAIERAGTISNSCGGKSATYSGTIVALDGHGDPIYTTTIIAP